MVVARTTYGSQPDARKPDSKRQAVLQQLVKENREKGLPPYQGIEIRTLGELLWILLIQKWAGGIIHVNNSAKHQANWFLRGRSRGPDPTTLPQAELTGIILSNADVRGFNFGAAILRDAELCGSNLSSSNLIGSDLSGALFLKANLSDALLLKQTRADELIAQRKHNSGPPYAGVTLLSRNEIIWMFQKENWSGEPEANGRLRPDLRETILDHVDLAGVDLTEAQLQGAKLLSDSDEDRLRAIIQQRQDQPAPFRDIAVRNRNELLWLMMEKNWSGDPGSHQRQRPNFRGADFRKARLQCADLEEANLKEAQLREVDLRGARLRRASLQDTLAPYARLQHAQLSGARLKGADLTLANLTSSDLFGAILRKTFLVRCNFKQARLSVADLCSADCREANLSGVDLRGAKVDAATAFIDIVIDTQTMFGDIVWFGTPLTQVDWKQAPIIGDEIEIEQTTGQVRQIEYRNATRAYRGLWTTLRRQGIYDSASRYRLREKRLERRAMREMGGFKNIMRWLSSWRSDVVSGYGEQPWKAAVCFVIVVLFYVPLYYVVGDFHLPFIASSGSAHLSVVGAFLLSFELFEGHSESLGPALSILGASETTIGAFILLAFTVLNTRYILGQG